MPEAVLGGYSLPALTNIRSLGYLIYTYYFYYFLMASLILLVAMIGAIVLTLHKRAMKIPSDHTFFAPGTPFSTPTAGGAPKKQLVFRQVARRFEEAVAFCPANSLRASSRAA
jgi:hypothetical protein